MLLTPTGDADIQSLAIGDMLITRSAGARRIKWIGEQHFAWPFIAKNRDKVPVTIRAGALGPLLPAADLVVAPNHGLLIGEQLVPAKYLVNGITVTQDEHAGSILYHRIEFDTHDFVLANGTWIDSFADGPGLRNGFHNIASFARLYPDHVTPAAPSFSAPQVQSAAAIDQILRPLTAHAAAGLAPGPMHGWIDKVTPAGIIEGWAQDLTHTELPVLLNIYLENRMLGTALACLYREDLDAAGIGAGRCMFSFKASSPIAPADLQKIQVRRAEDNAHLPFSHECQLRRYG